MVDPILSGTRAEGTALSISNRHCEKQSDEAIQTSFLTLDCFASLAMTMARRTLAPSARRHCRHVALVLHDDLVEGAEIGPGRSHQCIRIGCLGGHRTALMGEPHRH